MRRTVVAVLGLVACGLHSPAAAQDWTYRARAIVEAARVAAGDTARRSRLVVTAADVTWETGRWRWAGGFVVADASDGRATITAREAYGRVSVTPWMDIEAGKRLLRWSVGYGSAPAGVLDPARSATDPSDRLGRLEGMPLARVDFYRGTASVTVAAARSGGALLGGMRVNAVLGDGFDVSLIAAAPEGRRVSVGGNVTHVIGDRLGWHVELLAHDAAATGARVLSGVGGLQYTRSGINIILEYHLREADDAVFARMARAGADVRITPELIVMRSMDRGEWTSVAGLSVRVGDRLSIHARFTRRSPVTSFSAGLTARF